MSGGAFKNSSNLLSRRRELEDIEKEIGNYELGRELLEKYKDVPKVEIENHYNKSHAGNCTSVCQKVYK